MTPDEQYRQLVDEVRTLVRQSADRQGRLLVSNEVAARLATIGVDLPTRSVTAGSEKRIPATDEGAAPDLATLARAVAGCTRCGLEATRTQTVFGTGNPNAQVVFVGEAPGADEDRQGEPFVGRAGQLLTDIIVKGMMMRREDVYICNVLKCRPPGNRDPNPHEVQCCEPYLIRQLELIRPRVIFALGKHAAHTLLRTTESIGKLRERWHDYHGIPLRVTYHPAYLLRSPGEKRKAWEDVKEVLKLIQG